MSFLLAVQFMASIFFIQSIPLRPVFSTQKSIHRNNATIAFSGELAADGCGWLIKIEDKDNGVYSPLKLPARYRIDSLKVYITYKILKTRFQCGLRPGNGPVQIKILSIKQR